MKHIATLLAVLVFATTPLVAQGMYWESMTTTKTSDGKGPVTKYYYMPKKFKSVDEGQTAIMRLDKELMMLVDHEKKTYWQMTFDEMESMMKDMGGKMDEAMKQMEKEMAGMDPEQRKMVEQMMGKKMGGGSQEAVEVDKSSDTKSISGYKCIKYTLKQGDDVMATVWATKELASSEAMRKELDEFAKRMSAMMPKGMENIVKKSINTIDGFPIQTEMKGGSLMTVTKIEKTSVAASEFEVPTGYTKEDPPMMGKPERE
ncbi:MAG: DUF4412 domain-containing protein [Bacteroidota bacterium]